MLFKREPKNLLPSTQQQRIIDLLSLRLRFPANNPLNGAASPCSRLGTGGVEVLAKCRFFFGGRRFFFSAIAATATADLNHNNQQRNSNHHDAQAKRTPQRLRTSQTSSNPKNKNKKSIQCGGERTDRSGSFGERIRRSKYYRTVHPVAFSHRFHSPFRNHGEPILGRVVCYHRFRG